MTYLSQPALSRSHLYFITEEDLWSIPLDSLDAQATRLTAGLGPIATPKVSPDGKWIAVSSEEEGHCEVYLLPANGGELKRLTYLGAWSYPIGWKDDNTILFKSNAKHAHRMQEFFQIRKDGGSAERLNFGEGTHLDISQAGVVIERNMHRPDPSHWKRYRGGTMGQLWTAKGVGDKFQKLSSLPGNLSCPVWVNDRIFYLSDETGLGRIYSCDAKGETKRIHGGDFQSEYYFRNLTTNRGIFAFQSAGDLYLYDPKSDRVNPLSISVPSDHSKSKRKSVTLSSLYSDYSLQPQGNRLLLEGRGKVLNFAHWGGPVSTIGNTPGVRYKCADWLRDGQRVVLVADDGLAEAIEVYSDHGTRLSSIPGEGRIAELKTSPKQDELLYTNHRNELHFVDLQSGKSELIYQNPYQVVGDFAFSPDGNYVAYASSLSPSASQIAIWDKRSKKIEYVTEGSFLDYSPHFDPEGRYLYFLSKRIFNPIYDEVIFDMTFPKAGLPLLIVLKKDEPSPFLKESSLPDSLAKVPTVPKDFADATCEIDFDGIRDRIVQFPVLEAKYTRIVGLGKKVLWTYLPVEGTLTLNFPMTNASAGKEYLDCFDLSTGKFEYYGTGVTSFKVRHECGLRVVRSGNVLRLVKAGDKAEELNIKDVADAKSGVVDLTRANVMIDPKDEWKQMFRDAWRIQKEFFWNEDMLGIDWNAVYRRYEPVIQKVNCRREFSDVIWELIGELGTSHAYERGGDYRGVPLYSVGSLGAEFFWNEKEKGYEISRIYRGDPWSREAASPMFTPGVGVKPGDILEEIAGIRLTKQYPPEQATLNLSGQDVWIKFHTKSDPTLKSSILRLMKNDQQLLYREWVNEKRAIVKKLSQGKLGYIHIPNMMGQGFAEFHRNFLEEVECEGLVVDVRYNGGGHVSQLILDRLARKPLGRNVSRWMKPQSIPYETPHKVVVAVCNEFAGSDGDIFSHTFKMRKIGKLIGTRTWGGVVGIWPRNSMVDGGYTTQPEFSMQFNDVGSGIENHGAEPDVVVEFPPDAWARGEDPQLTYAIQEAMKSL